MNWDIRKDYKNLFEKIKVKSKKLHYQRLLSENSNVSKKTWDIIKELIGKSKLTNKSNLPKISVDENSISKKIEIAREFNNFFVNIGPNLATKIPNSPHTFESYIKPFNEKMSGSDLTKEELNISMYSLKINTSLLKRSVWML